MLFDSLIFRQLESVSIQTSSRLGRAKSSLLVFTFIHSRVQHSFCRGRHYLPTGVPSHFTHPQNADTTPLHLISYLGTLAHLEHCPYVPLPDLHTRFWRQQFYRMFKRHSLPRTFIQPGLDVLYLCFPPSRAQWQH